MQKYQTIMMDPPWPLGKTGKRKERPNQGTTLEYPTMSVEEIRAFPVNDFCAPECHLWLWATDRFLLDALKCIDVWGFTKHCVFVWKKPTGVCPYTVQFITEYLIFAYRGRLQFPKTIAGKYQTIIEAPKREHSRKPDRAYEIAATIGRPPMIDLFSREKREGWDQWGNQTQHFNNKGEPQ